MIDARWLNTIRSYINQVTLMQELIVLAGVVLFFVGMAAPGLFPKLIAFSACGGAIVYVFLSVRGTDVKKRESNQDFSVASEPEGLNEDSFVKVTEKTSKLVETKKSLNSMDPEERKPTSPTIQDPPREYIFKLSDFCDSDDKAFSENSNAKSEFSYLINKALSLIREVSFGYTAAFWWINSEKNQLVLESFVSDSDQFVSHRRRELGVDLISQVALTGHPRTVNRLSPTGQSEALSYYHNLESVRSFVAVPIFFPSGMKKEEKPVAVLSIDFLGEDVVGPESMEMLGRFSKMISALIKSYTGKYDLLVESELLRSIGRIHTQMKIDFTLHSIIRSLVEESSRLVTWDYIAAVLLDEKRKTWQIQVVLNRMNDGYVAVGQEIDPHHSIVGEVIQSGITKIIDGTQLLAKPRYYNAERVDSTGALMILPINSINRCYGALVAESKDKKTYSESDAKTLQKIIETAAAGLEIHGLNDVVNNYVLLDETTGVATRKYFMERLHQEVHRAKDYEHDVTVVMFSIDSVNEQLNRLGKDGFDFVLQNTGRLIKSFIRSYDIIGRFDFNRFAICLTNSSANDSYLWAEKVRKNIASNVINIDQKSFSVTVSGGICGLKGTGSDTDIIEIANQVLTRAIEAGGNIVRVY